jgi:hypothetical protein
MKANSPFQGEKQQGTIISMGEDIDYTMQYTGNHKPKKPSRSRTDMAA